MSIWTDAHAWQWLGRSFSQNFVREGLYYLLAALLLWLVVHKWLHKRLSHRVIAGWPTSADMRRELTYSLSTVLIFSAQGLVVFASILRGDMVIYFKPSQYGYWWLALSLPA